MAVLVLGIVSIAMALLCYGMGLIPAIVALSLAPGARREIDASAGSVVGAGQLKAGTVCAWIGVCLGAVLLLVWVGVVAVALLQA